MKVLHALGRTAEIFAAGAVIAGVSTAMPAHSHTQKMPMGPAPHIETFSDKGLKKKERNDKTSPRGKGMPKTSGLHRHELFGH